MYILIPGSVITILTFPGIVVHEFAHRFFCDVFKIPVYDACYFKLDDTKTAGYIVHQPVKHVSHAFFITFAPFIVNTILSIFFILPGVMQFLVLRDFEPLFYSIFLMWLGYSIGLHAIPSEQDMIGLLHALVRLDAKNTTIFIAKQLLIRRYLFGVSLIFIVVAFYWFIVF